MQKNTTTLDSKRLAEELKKGVKVVDSKRAGAIATTADGYSQDLDWEQHVKDQYMQEIYSRIGNGQKADYLEIKTDGTINKDFLKAFANLGGTIEEGKLQISSTKFESLGAELEKITGVKENVKVVEGKRITIDKLSPDQNADYMQRFHCKDTHCKNLHDKSDMPSTINDFVGVGTIDKLDKAGLAKIAEVGGIIENGVLKVPSSKLDTVKQLIKN